MAIASRGFFCGAAVLPGISVDGVIGFAEPLKVLVFVHGLLFFWILFCFEFAHVKNRFGYDVLLRGPVAEIADAAALAAKREVRASLGIGRRFANWAAMFHRKDSRRLVTRLSPNHQAGIFSTL